MQGMFNIPKLINVIHNISRLRKANDIIISIENKTVEVYTILDKDYQKHKQNNFLRLVNYPQIPTVNIILRGDRHSA